MTDPIMLGLPRSYFYAKIASAMNEVAKKNHELQFPVYVTIKEMLDLDRADDVLVEEQRQEMVIKVNIQEALSRLLLCPVCGQKLSTLDNYPQERSCECGDFTVTEVWGDGDVVFEFKMLAPEKIEEDGPDVDHDEGD